VQWKVCRGFFGCKGFQRNVHDQFDGGGGNGASSTYCGVSGIAPFSTSFGAVQNINVTLWSGGGATMELADGNDPSKRFFPKSPG